MLMGVMRALLWWTKGNAADPKADDVEKVVVVVD